MLIANEAPTLEMVNNNDACKGKRELPSCGGIFLVTLKGDGSNVTLEKLEHVMPFMLKCRACTLV